jgi:plastocyanin
MISAVALGTLGLNACGGDDSGDDAGSGDTIPADAVQVDALDIAFDMDEYAATAGDVTIAYVSEAQQVHSLVLFDDANEKVGDRLAVDPGRTDVGTFDLAAGTYSMICDIPGHREAGMVATLTVS